MRDVALALHEQGVPTPRTGRDADECQRIQGELEQLARREKATVEAQIAGINAGADPAAYASVFGEIRQKRDALKVRLVSRIAPDEAGENLRIEIPGAETVTAICVSSVQRHDGLGSARRAISASTASGWEK